MVRSLIKVIGFLLLCLILSNACSRNTNYDGRYKLSSYNGVSVSALDESEDREDGLSMADIYQIVLKGDKADFIIGEEITELNVRYDGSKVIMEGDGIVLNGAIHGKEMALMLDGKELTYRKVKA